MDITLQIVIEAANHDLSYDPAKNARRYRRGDIVNVYLRSEITEPPSPNTRLGFIHITGIPDTTTIQTIKEALLESSDIRRRLWRIPRTNLPQGVIDTLLADREITVTWIQAKPYIRKKVIANILDASQDDETTILSDGVIGA